MMAWAQAGRPRPCVKLFSSSSWSVPRSSAVRSSMAPACAGSRPRSSARWAWTRGARSRRWTSRTGPARTGPARRPAAGQSAARAGGAGAGSGRGCAGAKPGPSGSSPDPPGRLRRRGRLRGPGAARRRRVIDRRTCRPRPTPRPSSAADVPRGWTSAGSARPTGPVAGPARATRDPDVTRAAARRASPRPPRRRAAIAIGEARPALHGFAGVADARAGPGASGGRHAGRPDAGPGPAVADADVARAQPARRRRLGHAGPQDASPGRQPFTIEGQPGGRVVFSCLIPLAGRQAVAQRFEAEGEDAVAGGPGRPAPRRPLAGRPAATISRR